MLGRQVPHKVMLQTSDFGLPFHLQGESDLGLYEVICFLLDGAPTGQAVILLPIRSGCEKIL